MIILQEAHEITNIFVHGTLQKILKIFALETLNKL